MSTSAADASSSDSADPAKGSAGGDVCAQLEDLGATGTSWGPVQTFLSKADRLEDVEEKLAPMQEVPAPSQVADEWAAQQDWLEELQTAGEQLPDGSRLSDPELIAPVAQLTEAQQTLTGWWFDICQ